MVPPDPGLVKQFEVPEWLNWERLNYTRPRLRNGFKIWLGIGKRKPLTFLRSQSAS